MSPPATPPSQGHSLQPLPREPIYDHQPTYKPAALYPNKRTRTDSGWDARTPERTFPEAAPTSLPYMPTRHEETRPRSQFDLPTPSSRSPIIHSHHASPDLRGQRADLPRTYPSPALPRSDVYATSDPMLTARNRSSMYSNASSVSQDEDMRRHSGYGEYQPQPPRERYAVEPPRQSYMPAAANGMHREEYPQVARLDVPQPYGNAPYPYSHAFFVPSHYEYQNGKSRKRSNLPKQSTEIMKRWFDENMHNPYPSEEQKRHFAAVAGINLTQVSFDHHHHLHYLLIVNISFRSAIGSSTTDAAVPSSERSAIKVVLEAVMMTCNECPSISSQCFTFHLVQRILFLHIAWSFWALQQGIQGSGMT
jgi:hypothetical protein